MLLFFISLCIEIFAIRYWRHNRVWLPVLVLITSVSATMLVLQQPGAFIYILGLLAAVRIFNYFRIAKARMHPAHLRRTTTRTSTVMVVASLPFIGLATLFPDILFAYSALATLVIIQLAIAVSIFVLTMRNIRATRYRQGEVFYADKELPSVSVLIPARNETFDLEECLRTALASDYPKLEIIVLDDCSHAKTSEIIKSFAHKGVRFVKGEEPGNRWLAKNKAYDRLLDEASGSLVLFCGVDVRFGPHAIKALVTEMLQRKKTMISVLPHRLTGSPSGAFIQPMRYWWELVPPRKLLNRPPVLSTCWIIKRSVIRKLGGFDAVSHSIIPERFFARESVKSDAYSFIRSNEQLDIQTRKSYEEQRSTVLRTRYPELRRQPEAALLQLVCNIVFLLLPFVLLITLLGTTSTVIIASLLTACVLLVLSHCFIVYVSSPVHTVIALINFPVVVITDTIVTLVSMIKYEFGSVGWKDRNICIPVMHVYPRLPDRDASTSKY